jgi:chemotaxis signal transduction protein
VLSRPSDAQGTERLNAVLETINKLYTVYTRLVVFDASGKVRGASNDELEPRLLDSQIPSELLDATLKLSDSQRYAVSAFGPTALSGQKSTYIYLAAVRPLQGGSPVGGIAIVFNAEREFRAMLEDVLDGRAGIAAFVDSAGQTLASTDSSHVHGEPLPFAIAANVIELANANFSVASVEAAGYREFKSSDGYRNGVRAVVGLRLGALERRRMALFDRTLKALPSGAKRQLRELALFQVGSARYALPVHAVLEAQPDKSIVRLAQGGAHLVGLLEVGSGDSSTMVPVICARKLFGVDYPARATDGTVLILTDPDAPRTPLYGLRVDDVISVIDVDATYIQAAPHALRAHAPWLEAMVRLATTGDSPEEVLAQLLSPQTLAGFIRPASRTRAEACVA